MRELKVVHEIKVTENDVFLHILESMIKIRTFELRVAEIAKNREVRNPVHLYVGQEAIASSVCANLNADDYVYSTHRSHGHYLAQGGNMEKLMAEIFCRESGCSGGRGGSMHVTDRKAGFIMSSPIVGGSISIAAGSALAAKLRGKGQVSVAFFGDGATDEGVFYESINIAMIYNLPVIFICENNGFSTHLPDFMRQSNTNVTDRLKGFKINSARVDGNNPHEIYYAARKMIKRARNNQGPSLLECNTYRWLSHVGYWKDLDIGYRKKKDVEHWMKRCPINFLSGDLKSKGALTEIEYRLLNERIKKDVEKTVVYSRKSPSPDPGQLGDFLFE